MARMSLGALVGKADVDEDEPTAAAQPAAERSSAARRRTRPSTGEGRTYRPKVSFYQDPEDTERVRGAIMHTMGREGYRSMSEFIHEAVMAEVERLERTYNGGRPFPPVKAREMPQGRPIGQ